MKIKYKYKESVLRQNLSRIRRRYKVLLLACLGLSMISVGFFASQLGEKTGLIVEAKIHLFKLIKPKNFLSGLLTTPDRLYMDIKLKHLQKLRDDRKQAISLGYLSTIDADDLFVPVDLTFGNSTVKARTRLKGNSMSNRWSNRLSLRVKVSNENTIMGMNRFSLHDPIVKRNMDEWIFQRLLNYTGLISLRYEFVELIINGKNDGIYAIEENFESRLIGNNRLMEGIIIRFDEYWNYLGYISQSFNNVTELHNKVFSISPIDAYESSRIDGDTILRNQLKIARSLLEGYRLNDLPLEQVFNVSGMAKYLALTDLLGQHHSLEHRNFRFYYNPVTSRLDPVGYDMHNGISFLSINHALGEGKQFVYPDEKKNWLLWENSFFRDTLFFSEYIKFLDTFSDPKFLEEFSKSVKTDYHRSLNILYRNNPGLNQTVFETMRENQNYINRLLNPLKGLEVYVNEQQKDSLSVLIGSFYPLPLELRSFTCKSKEINHASNGLIIASKSDYEPMKFIEVKIPGIINLTDTINLDSLKLNYSLPGLNTIFSVNVHKESYYEREYVASGILQKEPNLKDFDFFTILESEKKLYIRPGQHTIRNSLIIPEGYEVICPPGTEINLLDNASIISYSAMHLFGTEEQPIKIKSADISGQGIAVLNASGNSTLSYVILEDLNNPAYQGWELTGAVTFYESPVRIQNCLFLKNHCEDALNIIRSEFQVYDCTFNTTNSDALDSDFSKGIISDTRFLNTGISAVNATGSNLDMSNITISNSGENGILAGERSYLQGNNIMIENSVNGIIAKDESNAELTNTRIVNCELGYTAFQNKTGFGPAHITASESSITQTGISFLLEALSSIRYNGLQIEPNQIDYPDKLFIVKSRDN